MRKGQRKKEKMMPGDSILAIKAYGPEDLSEDDYWQIASFDAKGNEANFQIKTRGIFIWSWYSEGVDYDKFCIYDPKTKCETYIAIESAEIIKSARIVLTEKTLDWQTENPSGFKALRFGYNALDIGKAIEYYRKRRKEMELEEFCREITEEYKQSEEYIQDLMEQGQQEESLKWLAEFENSWLKE